MSGSAPPRRITLGDVATELMNQKAGDAKPSRDHLEKAIVALKRQKDDAQAAKSLFETQLEGATLERDIPQQEVDRLRKIVSAGSLPHEGTDMAHMESLKWILVSQIDIVDMLHVIGTYISEGAEEQLLELAMLNKERIQQAGERSGIDRKEVMPEEHLNSLVPIRPQEMEPAKQRDTEERER